MREMSFSIASSLRCSRTMLFGGSMPRSGATGRFTPSRVTTTFVSAVSKLRSRPVDTDAPRELVDVERLVRAHERPEHRDARARGEGAAEVRELIGRVERDGAVVEAGHHACRRMDA